MYIIDLLKLVNYIIDVRSYLHTEQSSILTASGSPGIW